MNKSLFSLVLILILMSLNNAYCQSLSTSQRRTINETLLKLMKDYEKSSRFNSNNTGIDETYISQFNGLFDKNASLYNDILPSNKVSDPVSIREYVEIFRKYYPNGVMVKLHNLLFDTPLNNTPNNYKVNVSALKEIYAYTLTNVKYTDTIPLIFSISFKISENNIADMKILNITGDPRGRFLKFRVFKILTLKPVEDVEIKIDSKSTKTNDRGSASIENIDPAKTHILSISKEPYKKIVYTNLNIDKFIEGNTNKNHQRMKYDYYDPNEFIYFLNTLNFTLTPLISVSIPGLKTIRSEGQNKNLEIYNMKEKGSLSPRLGVQLGVTLFRTHNIDFLLKAGIDKNFIRSSYSFDSCLNKVMVSDFHGPYTRTILMYDQEQKITMNFTEFPILISINCRRFKKFEIGAEFGIRFSYLSKSSCSIKSGYSTRDPFQKSDTVLTKDYHSFVPASRFFAFQFDLRISREIYPSLYLYASPTLFLYKNALIDNNGTQDILTPDKNINNILLTYKRSKLQYVALEFGLRYNFNSINLRKKQ